MGRILAQLMMQEKSTAFNCAPDRRTSIGFESPVALVAWTICLGTGIRLLLAASLLDLGHSEAYYIAASRHFALSYFDHPPLSFWIAWVAMKLTRSDAVLVVRAPFILLFIATTWLMFRFHRIPVRGKGGGLRCAPAEHFTPVHP